LGWYKREGREEMEDRVGRWWTIRVGRGGGILRWKKREVSRTTMRGRSWWEINGERGKGKEKGR
jgi:hypothetical protein